MQGAAEVALFLWGERMSKIARPLPAQSELLQIFDLDPASGFLTRKSDGRSAWRAGSNGYATVSVGGKGYLLHRIIWAMARGPSVRPVPAKSSDAYGATIQDGGQLFVKTGVRA